MKTFLKFTLTIGLIGTIFFGSASKFCLLISYEINKLEIIEKFCINKEETRFKCDGKCYLKSELDKAEPEQEDTPYQSSSNQEERLLLYSQTIDQNSIFNTPSLQVQFRTLLAKANPGYVFPLFRPPGFS